LKNPRFRAGPPPVAGHAVGVMNSQPYGRQSLIIYRARLWRAKKGFSTVPLNISPLAMLVKKVRTFLEKDLTIQAYGVILVTVCFIGGKNLGIWRTETRGYLIKVVLKAGFL
jgi:hypothetical protein